MNQGSGIELYLQLLCFLPTLLKREGEPISLKNVLNEALKVRIVLSFEP